MPTDQELRDQIDVLIAEIDALNDQIAILQEEANVIKTTGEEVTVTVYPGGLGRKVSLGQFAEIVAAKQNQNALLAAKKAEKAVLISQRADKANSIRLLASQLIGFTL